MRDDELEELDGLLETACELHPVQGGSENPHGKVNILLQSYISRAHTASFSLVSEMSYVAQNAARILRGLCEIAVRKNLASIAAKLVTLCISLDRRLWAFRSPLRQFEGFLKPEVLMKIEDRKLTVDRMADMPADEIGHMLRHVAIGEKVKRAAEQLPMIALEASIQPITRTVLRVSLKIQPLFVWNTKVHGKAEPFWIWVEDPESDRM